MTLRVGVFGAGGRMGSTVCRAVFDDPDRFDPDRFVRDPSLSKRLLTFGHGSHLCVGMYLARMEAEVAWPRLCERFAGLERADDAPLDWIDTLIVRGLARLPIATRAAG